MGALPFICVLSLIVASISSLPIKTINELPRIELPELKVPEILESEIKNNYNEVNTNSEQVKVEDISIINNGSETGPGAVSNKTSNLLMRNNVRPGMIANNYEIEITPNGERFQGRLLVQVQITDATTREDDVIFQVEDLAVSSVMFSLAGGSTFSPAEFFVDDDDGLLFISTGIEASLYSFVIEYEGIMGEAADGLFSIDFNGGTYMGMNLHPTHARRVFPCIDEPTEATTISFSFNDLPFNNVIMNSMLEDGSTTDFRALQGPPHLWGMVAHNFNQLAMVPAFNVILYGRSGLNQDQQAQVAINNFMNTLVEWTNKPYNEIVLNQDGRMHIFALTDTSREWTALSTVCIWEPYVLMETNNHAMKHKRIALVKIAEAMARQWFGYVIYPENWSNQWVVSGLGSYAAYEIVKELETDVSGIDITVLDFNTLFVTEVIQESLLQDGYANAAPLEPDGDIFDEADVRDHIYGLMKYKAPAIMWMLRIVLGDEDTDYVQLAAQVLLNNRALQTVNSLNFYDAVRSNWLFGDTVRRIEDVTEFLEPWVTSRGYPLVHVALRQGGLLVLQEHFGFTADDGVTFDIPISYTTSINPNYDNIYPVFMLQNTQTLQMVLDEEDYVIFNIQGQGYYRVTYDDELWERIIEALQDPDRREEIHPLNRATLVDDALNLARAGKLDYDIAFRVVLSMEHETEYAVWKAFVRNMSFLKKRLEALVFDDEDLDPDIYLRMVRRTIGRVQDELTFYPDINVIESSMESLTRGLVMDHACRANYAPCIAAAVDWFWDPDSGDPTVNPNIPREIRPAVYCTMVKEGDGDVIDALYDRLEIEPNHYERLVILESLACSQDQNFINTLLIETISDGSPYGVEERSRIFIAVAEASFTNAGIAMNFISRRANDIRNMYGGPEKLEEVIHALANNMVDDWSFDFRIWVESSNNNLDDSENTARRALERIQEQLEWDNAHMEYVYEWIDENDAPTLAISLLLVCITFVVTLFNH